MSRNSKSDQITSLKSDNVVITNPTEILENFNKHFTEIGLKLSSQIQFQTTKSYPDYLNPTTSVFTLNPTTSNVVYKFLTLILEKKATGLDEIPCKLLEHAGPIISESLCDLFNFSI